MRWGKISTVVVQLKLAESAISIMRLPEVNSEIGIF